MSNPINSDSPEGAVDPAAICSTSLRTWEIPDEIHETVSALMEENARLKKLLTISVVEGQRFAIWLLGHRKDPIGIADLPNMESLPGDVREMVRALRKEKYGIV